MPHYPVAFKRLHWVKKPGKLLLKTVKYFFINLKYSLEEVLTTVYPADIKY